MVEINTDDNVGAASTETKTEEEKSAELLAKKDTEYTTGAEPIAKKDEETVPWDKDPRWQKWKTEETALRSANDKLTDLLEKNDLDDADDLLDLIASGKAIKGKISDINDIDTLIERASKLDNIEAYWEDQEENRKRGEETADETISRQDAELKKRDKTKKEDQDKRKLAEDSAKAVKFYERSIEGLIEDESIPKEQRGVVLEFLGVGNPINEIDITDKRAVKTVFRDTKKKFEDYDQWVIKQYLEGKKEVPIVTKTDISTAEPESKTKNLKEARAIMKERLTTLFKGG